MNTIQELDTHFLGSSQPRLIHFYQLLRPISCPNRTSEELIETLEENQVQLQNMMASKYISYFLEEISSWQKCLSMVDQVISLWFDVQRTWSHLESIFIGSEDIRKQLPVDSQRFDEIDTEFKVLMKQMAKTPNVVKVRESFFSYSR